ncbi:MAG: hypothetical protein HQ538_00795 [Parcubacteria group bacterium]|nr:hypothetical protein [Parcubacteria group bacterium]
MKFKKTILTLTTIFVTFPGFVLALDMGSYLGFDTSTPQGYINSIYRYGLTLIALLATAGIVYGGVRYLTSMGNEEAATSGKQAIFAALSGLVIALLSHMILKTIDPRLVELKLVLPVVDLPDRDCNFNSDCSAGNDCVDYQCVPPYYGETGSPCRSEEDCGGGEDCIRINPGSGRARCTDYSEGAPCASDDNCRTAGTYCHTESHRCTRGSSEDDSDHDDTRESGELAEGSECNNNSECLSNICSVEHLCLNGTNNPCTTSGSSIPCQRESHYCPDYCELDDRDIDRSDIESRRCRPKKSNGARCYYNYECIAGECDGYMRTASDSLGLVCWTGTCADPSGADALGL